MIREDIEDAVDFVDSEFSGDFEVGDRYFNGEVDIPVEEGRSSVVSTAVRDAIRNLRPSVLRVLCSNRRRLVKYIPSNIRIAGVVEQQEAYVHQLFWANNGYRVLYDATDESMKHRIGAVKTYWEANPTPDYVKLTALTLDEVQFLSEMPDVEILEIEKTDIDDYATSSKIDVDEEIDYYDVECERQRANGRICMEAVPYGEFFVSRNARSCADARVHGHRRSVTVAEAMEMGLDYDDWLELDDLDPESAEVQGSSTARRGYQKHEEPERGDLLSHRFLLTEAYVRIDLEDVGFDQLYCVYLGGTSYELLDHYREAESPFDVICHDPRAFTVVGTSISDIAIPQQDILTSLLRGMVDNIHMANNPRLAANPSQVNFDDLQNWNIGHPIRMKGQGNTVQVIGIPSQIQSSLPMLQYLDQDAQNKLGVTKAAQGLDPNAMQSTDKQAVQNTIQLSQGQVELAVRNIIETGVIGIFRKLLKLSIQHLDRQQVVRMRGMILPVDQLLFDPDLQADPQVGLGTVDDEKRLAGLQLTLQMQQTIYQQMGINNPFVTATHIYNTLEDITEEFGLYDVSRYYNMVTPEIEAQFAQQRAEQAAQEAASQSQGGMDPAMALIESENIKAGTEKLKQIVQSRGKALELQLKSIELDAKDDLERDKMAQDRILKEQDIALKRETAQAGVERDGIKMVHDMQTADAKIKAEQEAPREKPSATSSTTPA